MNEFLLLLLAVIPITSCFFPFTLFHSTFTFLLFMFLFFKNIANWIFTRDSSKVKKVYYVVLFILVLIGYSISLIKRL